ACRGRRAPPRGRPLVAYAEAAAACSCETAPVKLTELELRRVRLPLVSPFRTSFGTETERDVLLVKATTPDGEGWGECVALADPVYSPEYVDGAQHVLRTFLAPALFGVADLTAAAVAPALAFVKGHRMAKAAVETAVL